MKFIIDSKDFKTATERAASIITKGATQNLLFVADKTNKRVVVRASGLDLSIGNLKNSAVEIYLEGADVLESGEAIVNIKSIKQLYNVGGKIEVETKDLGFRVSNGKKKSEVSTIKEDVSLVMPVTPTSNLISDKPVFVADKKDLIDTLSKISCCLLDENLAEHELQKCFHLSNISGVDRVYGSDGYKLLQKDVDWSFSFDSTIDIPKYVSKEFLKISKNNFEENIKVFICGKNEKYLLFVGKDFKYRIMLGDPCSFDTEKLLNLFNTYRFSLNRKNLLSISEEYSKIPTKKFDKNVMYFLYNNYEVTTAHIDSDYRTLDTLKALHTEGKIETDSLLMRFNPVFIKEIVSVFEDDTITIEGTNNKINLSNSPWKFTSENSKYVALICPIHISQNEDLREIINFIESK